VDIAPPTEAPSKEPRDLSCDRAVNNF
jgi:hypothetical protein